MAMSNPTPIRRALLSVSDKTGIASFARALQGFGIEILSTGGTHRLLAEEGIPSVEVSDHTGFPEIMEGRVKTLHPRIHGGILSRRDMVDEAVLKKHDIPPIDLVVVNLYPFRAVTEKPDCDLATAIENIDIGGPAMLRAAAKNHLFTAAVVEPEDYEPVLAEMGANDGGLTETTRFNLARKAFEHTAVYDGDIADYLNTLQSPDEEDGTDGDDGDAETQWPPVFSTQFNKQHDLRYGENPHQEAAFYADLEPPEGSIATVVKHQGKDLSYNNIVDSDAALECVKSFTDPACVIVKHSNPCGVAEANSLPQAYELAYQTDPTSAFGGVIAFNRELDPATAKRVIDNQFVEVIIAPAVTEEVLAVTQAKKNLIVLSCGWWHRQLVAPLWQANPEREQDDLRRQTVRPASLHLQQVFGGMLVQERDIHTLGRNNLNIVSKRPPTESEMRDLLFAWPIAQYVKSNAIVYCRDRRTVGIGAGQMSRIYSARIAGLKAADGSIDVKGAVMASDAFFPFRDGIDAAAEAGITAVIQPGGSIRDDEVIAAADEADMAMVFTGVRHFRH